MLIFPLPSIRHLMNEKNARNCINFLFKHFRWAQNLSFSRFVIEYILEKFIKLSATRVQARVENRIILKLYTYCPIIHTHSVSERDLPWNVELTHDSLTQWYHSTLSNDQSYCTVGVFRWEIFFSFFCMLLFILNISDMILLFHIFFSFLTSSSVHCCYFKQLLTLGRSVLALTWAKLPYRRRQHNFLHAYTGKAGKRRKKNPKEPLPFPFHVKDICHYTLLFLLLVPHTL